MSNQILKDNNFKFNKAYGQNFIFDKNFLKSIVDGLVSSNDEVLEIGTGAGTLTAMLSSHAKKVISYEIDKNLQPILSETLKSYNNCKVIFEDIMNHTTTQHDNMFDENNIDKYINKLEL